jgi:hypothetical protein
LRPKSSALPVLRSTPLSLSSAFISTRTNLSARGGAGWRGSTLAAFCAPASISPNTTLSPRKPAVLTFATLFAITSSACCCASAPLNAV